MLKNSVFNALGGVSRIIVGFLSIPILIRLLGVEEYGLWTLVSTVTAIVSLAEAGLSNATTVFVSKDLGEQNNDGVVQTTVITSMLMLTLATIVSAVLWTCSDHIALSLFSLRDTQYSATVESLKVASFVAWLKLIQQVLIGLEQAYQKYPVINALTTAQSLLTNLGMLLVAFNGGKVVALMQWHLVVNLIALFSHFTLAKSLDDFRLEHIILSGIDHKKLSTIIFYSFNAWVGSLGGVIFGQFDKVVVSGIMGVRELGIYAAITSLCSQINSFSSMVVQPLLPIISSSRELAASGKDDIKKTTKLFFELNLTVVFSMGFILLANSNLVLSLIIGNELIDVQLKAFQLSVVIYAIYSCNASGYYILLAIRETKLFLLIQLFTGILSLLFIYVGCLKFGLLGAVLGNSAYFFVWGLTAFGMYKLNIKLIDWLSWLLFPLSWFVISSLLVYIVSSLGQSWFSQALTIICLTVIFYWFLKSNNLNLMRLKLHE